MNKYREEREKHLSVLSDIMDSMPDDACGDWRDSIAYAISSIKTDLYYDYLCEKIPFITMDELKEIREELEKYKDPQGFICISETRFNEILDKRMR